MPQQEEYYTTVRRHERSNPVNPGRHWVRRHPRFIGYRDAEEVKLLGVTQIADIKGVGGKTSTILAEQGYVTIDDIERLAKRGDKQQELIEKYGVKPHTLAKVLEVVEEKPQRQLIPEKNLSLEPTIVKLIQDLPEIDRDLFHEVIVSDKNPYTGRRREGLWIAVRYPGGKMLIRPGYENDKRTIFHEYGHQVWDYRLSPDQKQLFREAYKGEAEKHRSELEAFSEAYAWYYAGGLDRARLKVEHSQIYQALTQIEQERVGIRPEKEISVLVKDSHPAYNKFWKGLGFKRYHKNRQFIGWRGKIDPEMISQVENAYEVKITKTEPFTLQKQRESERQKLLGILEDYEKGIGQIHEIIEEKRAQGKTEQVNRLLASSRKMKRKVKQTREELKQLEEN